MPGPVSDSYDPEFGSATNARIVRDGMSEVVAKILPLESLRPIVEVAREPDGPPLTLRLSEREWRLVRFGLLRASESL